MDTIGQFLQFFPSIILMTCFVLYIYSLFFRNDNSEKHQKDKDKNN